MTENNAVSPDNYSRIRGREAQDQNIAQVKLLGEVIKTTLGPKGMDKLLMDPNGRITVTNDGVTILREMEIKHPAAKMISEIANTQENEIGDGTTTVAMLAGKLLDNADKLILKGIHPTIIIKGFELASEKAMEILESISIDGSSRDMLKKVAMTAMTGKGAEGNREKLAEIILDAVKKVEGDGVNFYDNIKITKSKGQGIDKSEMVEGMVLEYPIMNDKMPKSLKQAKIALCDFDLGIKMPEKDVQIQAQNPQVMQQFLDQEKMRINEMLEIIDKSEANVIFCAKGIDDGMFYQFAKRGVIAIRRVNKYDMDQLAKATGAEIVSSIDELNKDILGESREVFEKKTREESLIYVTGCKNAKAVTILMHGTTSHVLDEVTRALTDGLGDVIAVLKEKRVVSGGGAVEMELAKRLREYANTLPGREQLAVTAFADSLEVIPETLATNAGLDSIEMLTKLKTKHDEKDSEDSKYFGLNLFSGKIEDTFNAGIIEPLKIKTQAISSAMEVSTMILRIDDLLIAKAAPQQ